MSLQKGQFGLALLLGAGLLSVRQKRHQRYKVKGPAA